MVNVMAYLFALCIMRTVLLEDGWMNIIKMFDKIEDWVFKMTGTIPKLLIFVIVLQFSWGLIVFGIWKMILIINGGK